VGWRSGKNIDGSHGEKRKERSGRAVGKTAQEDLYNFLIPFFFLFDSNSKIDSNLNEF
jgi:hypothetical protein